MLIRQLRHKLIKWLARNDTIILNVAVVGDVYPDNGKSYLIDNLEVIDPDKVGIIRHIPVQRNTD